MYALAPEAAPPQQQPVEAHALIDAVDLERRFGRTLAVSGVSLRVAAGEVLALLGPNGAGKTTTMQVLAALLPPSAGRARVAGFDLCEQPREVRARVGLMIDEPGFYPEMRVEEYLIFVARLYNVPPRQARRRAGALLERFELAAKRQARLASLSKGMRQKVALIRCLLHEPPVLLLDEPTSALDPLSARAVHQFIRERREAGTAIVLCTHNLPEAEELADRVALIAAGRLQRVGTQAELCRAPDGLEAFLLTLAGEHDERVTALLAGVPGLQQPAALGGGPTTCRYRYRTATPEATNALLSMRLAAAGRAVVGLTPQPRSLGEVYLETIAEAER
jgi:ABC-2 type transport system ATP-binding protein